MAFLCSKWTPNNQINYFMFEWSIYRLFVLNRACKLDSHQIMIFVYVWSTWNIVELKARFKTWITRIDVNGVRFFKIAYLIIFMAYHCSQTAPNVQIKYFMFDWSIYRLYVLNAGWKRDSLQMMIFVNICPTWSIVHLKTRFETWKTRNGVNGVGLFHLSYLIPLMVYLCSQWTPNVKIKNFMFDCSIYRLLVLNRRWKPDPFKIRVFLYVCSTWSLVEFKAHFETCITRNDVNGISLFHLSYLITLMAYLCSQRTPNV
jgi:hypothetical protein